jgi:hypothetical protein
MPVNGRTQFQGVRTIVRLNWPLYAVAGGFFAMALGVLIAPSPEWMKWPAMVTTAGCLWFLAGSLGVSFWIYDRSPLYQWTWLAACKVPDAARVAICHTGFDEVSGPLQRRFPHWQIRVLDHFDVATMTEASIRRARRVFPPRGAELVAFDAWPEFTSDIVFAILSIHELRSECERTAWFAQARRHLAPGGSLLLVEHVRDLANFAAFGPGFFHFHTVASWRHCWEQADFRAASEQRLTPFVRVFVLK